MSAKNFVEISGSSVEDAIEKGLKQLGVGPSQVIVEVLEEPSRGLFGLGSKEARVRLQLLAPPSPPTAPPAKTPPPPPVEEDSAPPSQPQAAKQEAAPPESSDVYGDDDDFFDEDGSYGEGAEDTTAPAEKTPVSNAPAYEDLDAGIDEVEQSPEEMMRERRERIEMPTRGRRYGEGGGRGRGGNNRGNRGDGRRKEGRGNKEGSRGDGRRKRGGRGRGRGKREESTVVTPPIEFEEGATDVGISEQVLTELLDLMDLPATLNTTRAEASDGDGDDGPPWILNIEGESEDITPLIGRKGDTLSSLQYLTRLIVSKQIENRANVIIDVDSYRLQRAEKIGNLANRMADQAVETSRTVIMEPMPPHERRIIHMTLRKRDDVDTESTGEGKGRRVTIIPNPDIAQ